MADDWNRYGPTAARASRKARARDAAAERHHRPARPHRDPAGGRVRQAASRPCRPFRSRISRRRETKALNMRQDADRRPRMTQYDERLADLDAMGIDLQLVMCPPPQCYYTVPLDIAVQAARMVNDGIAEYVAGKPDRFVALGTVPMPDGARGRQGARALHDGAQVQGRADPHQRGGTRAVRSRPSRRSGRRPRSSARSCCCIRNGFTEAARLTRFYFNNVIGNPFETTLALHYLIFDGVLERHPNLKILAVHGGGYLGAYSGRIDHAWGARSDCQAEPAEAADALPQEDLFRHGGVHAPSAPRPDRDVRGRSCRHGHGLSLRHGGVRADRAPRFGRARRHRRSRRSPD